MKYERPIEKDIAYGAAFVFGFAASMGAQFPLSISCIGGLLAVVIAFVLIALFDSIQFHGPYRVIRDSVLTYTLTGLILLGSNLYFEFQPWEELKFCMLVGIPVIPLATAINLRPRTYVNRHPLRDT